MRTDRTVYPLSNPQSQIWLSSESCPDKRLFTESVLFTFHGAPDPEHLNQILNDLVRNTEVLRIRLAIQDGAPVQYDAGYIPFACRVCTIADNEELHRHFDLRAREPMELYDCPLFDAELLSLPDSTAVLMRIHHIIADGFGFTLIYDRFLALCAGEAYRPFVSFLSRVSAETDYSSAEREADRAFWTGYLEGVMLDAVPRPLPKPLDFGMAWASYPVGHTLSGRLQAFAKSQNLTPYSVFFAAYAFYLSRVLSTEDVVVIVPRLNRAAQADREASGMFTVAVPVRLRVAPETSFLDLCRQAGDQSALAAAHKAYGLSEILSDLSRNGSAGTLSYFTLSYQNFALPLHGLDVDFSMHFGAACTNLLTMHVLDWEGGGDYHMQLDYRSGYYTAAEITRLAESLRLILSQGLEEPGRPCNGFELLSSQEKLRLRQQFAGPELASQPKDTIVSLFHKQAMIRPDARAVTGKGRPYTFAELDAVSEQVARNLLDSGIEPQSMISFLLPRTTDLVVILLGILKAGCAFIPIDTTYPEGRIQYILSDSGATALICDGARAVPAGCRILSPSTLLSPAGSTQPLPAPQADWLCYVIYTSGTTGRPKGVLIRHRGVVNFVQPDNNPFNRDIVHNGTGIVAVGSICFDISMFELFSTLLNGIPVVFADENGMNAPDALADYITENGANILHCTPSRLLSYLEDPKFRDAMRQVDVVLAAGEVFTRPLLDALQKATSARLYNGYGPTEVTIGATVGQVTDRITIGAPIAGTRVYLLDKYHRLLPEGVSGEIAVGGPGLAQGYLNREDLTAQRFVQFQDGPVAERVYLTGDYGYGLPSGELVYCGRNDDQIKLRGLRIELQEIESCVESYPGVRQCAALATEFDGRQHLCCFYSAAAEYDSAALKQYADGFLARYMVPDTFLYLPQLPHTPNGKIDKLALARMEIHVEHTYVPPANAMERTLCAIFGQVLNLEKVGVTDNFFECGGTSLLAARVVLLAKHENLSISYGTVFDCPTPRSLAQYISQDSGCGITPVLADQEDICTSEEAVKLREALFSNRAYRRGLSGLGTVLLTGATGFLGIHILYELLTVGYGDIYCVVRPKNGLSPEKRLKGSLFYYFENSFAESFGKRLFAVDGDLLRPGLASLPDGVQINTVINCAADVSHFGVDNRIRQTNVDGVKNVIAFCQERDAALIQISTLSVGGFIDQELANIGASLSERRLWIHQDLSNAYLESKFTAEKLVLLATLGGLKGKIMRVGNLQGRITDGEFQMNQTTNGFTKLLQSMVHSGFCPESLARSWINFSPVDATARAICRMAGSDRQYTVFHIFDSNDMPVSKLLSHLSELGYPIQVLDDAAFDRYMLQTAEDPAKSGILDGFLTRVTGGRHMVEAPCESSFSIRALEQEGFLWPEITDPYLHAYLLGLDTLGTFDS